MRDAYARTMFSDAAKKLQGQAGSRQAYERMARAGHFEVDLGSLRRSS